MNSLIGSANQRSARMRIGLARSIGTWLNLNSLRTISVASPSHLCLIINVVSWHPIRINNISADRWPFKYFSTVAFSFLIHLSPYHDFSSLMRSRISFYVCPSVFRIVLPALLSILTSNQLACEISSDMSLPLSTDTPSSNRLWSSSIVGSTDRPIADVDNRQHAEVHPTNCPCTIDLTFLDPPIQ
jgi:hypothetical protein